MTRLEEAIDVLTEGAGVASRRRAVELVREAMTAIEERGGARPSETEDVRAFSLKMGQLVGDAPRLLAKRKLAERLNFVLEELRETATAGGLELDPQAISFVPGDAAPDLFEIADGLVDLVYVAKGTALMMGIPWEACWDEVQRANMAKVPGPSAKRGSAVDAVKPPGWKAPDHRPILVARGFDPDRPGAPVDDAAFVAAEVPGTSETCAWCDEAWTSHTPFQASTCRAFLMQGGRP